jgi:putative FmdB family regulatory protein
MPIFDYCCEECGHVWESIEVWSSHAPKECPKCKHTKFSKVIGVSNIRMDPDTVKHNLPDPTPPLEELRGKGNKGYKDKPHAEKSLNAYERKRDKYGNTHWVEKRKQYFDLGKK